MALDTWAFQTVYNPTFPIGLRVYRESGRLSYRMTFNESGSEAKRVFWVDWNNYPAFVEDVLGYSFTQGTGTGTTVKRVLPEAHPELQEWYADSVSVTPVATDAALKLTALAPTSQWRVAQVEVSYRPLGYRVIPDALVVNGELDRFVSRKTLAKGDYLQLNVGSFKWVQRGTETKPLAATPGIIAPTKTLEYTWHYVPQNPNNPSDLNSEFRCPVEDKIVRLLGLTNSTTFDTVYLPQTVLFVAAEAELILPRITNGRYHWRVRYFFEQKDNGLGIGSERAGVNYLYDPINMRWDLITTTGLNTGQRLYNTADLGELFKLSPLP